MVKTNGNIIVEDIKVGDVHDYIFDDINTYLGEKIKTRVIVLTLPQKDSIGSFTWKAESTDTGKEINFAVHPDYPQYSPILNKHELQTSF